MSYKEEKYIDLDGQELSKITHGSGNIHYINEQGQIHRLGGPAYIRSIGTEYWYKNYKLHRLDGPAVVWSNGKELYFIEGKKVSKREIDLYWIKKQVGK